MMGAYRREPTARTWKKCGATSRLGVVERNPPAAQFKEAQ